MRPTARAFQHGQVKQRNLKVLCTPRASSAGRQIASDCGYHHCKFSSCVLSIVQPLHKPPLRRVEAERRRNSAALSRAAALAFGIPAAARHNVIGGSHCTPRPGSGPSTLQQRAAATGSAWAPWGARGDSPRSAGPGACHAKRLVVSMQPFCVLTRLLEAATKEVCHACLQARDRPLPRRVPAGGCVHAGTVAGLYVQLHSERLAFGTFK